MIQAFPSRIEIWRDIPDKTKRLIGQVTINIKESYDYCWNSDDQSRVRAINRMNQQHSWGLRSEDVERCTQWAVGEWACSITVSSMDTTGVPESGFLNLWRRESPESPEGDPTSAWFLGYPDPFLCSEIDKREEAIVMFTVVYSRDFRLLSCYWSSKIAHHSGLITRFQSPGRLLAVLGGCLEDWESDLGMQPPDWMGPDSSFLVYWSRHYKSKQQMISMFSCDSGRYSHL